ncbi:MAG: phospholipase D-like domain-containing protein, partial [Bacteroidales bacterium]
LRTAALGGVEVRIMLPEEADSRFVHYASLSYISELLDAGVKVYLYTKGFIHSKTISIDGTCCVIGSANLDNRSLEHHFEVGAIIYNPRVSMEVENQFDKYLNDSRLIVRRTWNKRPFRQKVNEQLTRLLSPLL